MTRRLDADDPCPVRDGYTMPAEWATHERTWMCWPCRMDIWGGPEGLSARQAGLCAGRAGDLVLRAGDHGGATAGRSGGAARDGRQGRSFRRRRSTIPGPAISVRHFCADKTAHAQAWRGSSTPGATNIIRIRTDAAFAGRVLKAAGLACLSRTSRLRRRGNPFRWRRNSDHDRTVPAQHQPQCQSGPPAGGRASCALYRVEPRHLARARAFPTTRPTDMSTTSRASHRQVV